MKYYGTDIEVKLGDRVIYRHVFFRKSPGVVSYLPGISKVNPRLIPNQWIVSLGHGRGVAMFYSTELEFAHWRVAFLTRGENDSEIAPDEMLF